MEKSGQTIHPPLNAALNAKGETMFNERTQNFGIDANTLGYELRAWSERLNPDDDEVGSRRSPDDRDRVPDGAIGDKEKGKKALSGSPKNREEREINEPKIDQERERERNRAPSDRIQDGTPNEKMWAKGKTENTKSKSPQKNKESELEQTERNPNHTGEGRDNSNPDNKPTMGGVADADPVKARLPQTDQRNGTT